MRVDVVNSIGCCVGLFQIHVKAHWSKIPGNTWEEKATWLKDYRNNIKIAKQIFDAQSWDPWEAYTNGKYKKFLQ